MQALLLLLAFILPPGADTGKIIGGREARPHSRPYMAYLQIQTPEGLRVCGGFLVREDFVMTAGDSGGPLVCNNVAQGIVSYGDRNGTPPAVFTRISSFLPWIKKTMRRFQPWDQTETHTCVKDSFPLRHSPAPGGLPEP
uniref:Peptidase S1 domain-containing protein n=1 Tax=Castor canadensis TaxID=51338 RepID=A0A8C0W6I5_CASCN